MNNDKIKEIASKAIEQPIAAHHDTLRLHAETSRVIVSNPAQMVPL